MKNTFLTLFSLVLLVACLDSSQVSLEADDSGNDNANNDDITEPVLLDCNTMGSIVNNQLDTDAKKYLLCLHNKFRSDVATGKVEGYAGLLPMATDMQALAWDNTLEQVAQNYADQCIWGHNNNRTTDFENAHGNPAISYVGENIAYTSSTANPMLMGYVRDRFNDMATGEADDWSYGSINITEFCDTGKCGHATQMFWADTRYLGCAISHCSPSMNPHPDYPDLSDIYLVCNYGQGGNIENRLPYIEALQAEDICSDDRSGSQTECTEGLTHAADYRDGL